jgi:hypothetical protein
MNDRPWSLLLLCVFSAMAVTGCGSRAEGDSPSAEPALSVQAAIVRAGENDQIQIEQSPLDDNDLESIAGLSNLRVLLIDHPKSRFSAAGLNQLAALTSLEQLRIRGTGIDDAVLAQLAQIKSLRVLNLPQGSFSDQALAHLSALEHLEQLRFGSPYVTSAGMKIIAELPALKRLHLIQVPITDEGLREIAKMEQLESLYIDGANLSDAAIDELFRRRPRLHVHMNQQHHDRDPHGHSHP